MKPHGVVPGCILLLMMIPSMAAAQMSQRFAITPRVGAYVPLNEIGAAAPADNAWYVHLGRAASSASLELALDVQWPASRLGLRLLGLHTLAADARGTFNCYPGVACPEVILPAQAEVSTLAVMAAAVYSLRRNGRVRPYTLAGFGFKRYDYAWDAPAVLLPAGSHAETSPLIHAGLGLSLELPRSALRLEVADYWSPSGDGADTQRTAGASADNLRRRQQHDIGISMGWQLLRF